MDKIDLLSEEIERKALESMHNNCPKETRDKLGLELIEVADCIVALSTNDPSILLNRTLGLGVEQEVTVDSLKRIKELYSSRNIDNYFLHIYEEGLDESSRDLLNSKEFTKKRGWMKFRSTEPSNYTASTDFRIEVVGMDKSTDFGTIVCGAFGMTELSIPLLASLAKDDRWYLFVSYEGDTPAGAGSLFVDGELGWLEWGATHPDFRSRGSQAKIMAERLKLAWELGCKYIFTETGEAVEGDRQHSYKNILKAGFSESILRLNYGPGEN